MLFSLNIFNGCSEVEPITQNVCEIAIEVCTYTNLICSQIAQDTTLTLSPDDEYAIKSDLLEVKQKLEEIKAKTK